jgi:hypothetical protein
MRSLPHAPLLLPQRRPQLPIALPRQAQPNSLAFSFPSSIPCSAASPVFALLSNPVAVLSFPPVQFKLNFSLAFACTFVAAATEAEVASSFLSPFFFAAYCRNRPKRALAGQHRPAADAAPPRWLLCFLPRRGWANVPRWGERQRRWLAALLPLP